MINEPPPFKGLNIRIPIMIPIKGRRFINQRSGLACKLRVFRVWVNWGWDLESYSRGFPGLGLQALEIWGSGWFSSTPSFSCSFFLDFAILRFHSYLPPSFSCTREALNPNQNLESPHQRLNPKPASLRPSGV